MNDVHDTPGPLVAWAPCVDGLRQPALYSADHGVRFRESTGDLAVGLDGVEGEAGAVGDFGDAEISLHAVESTHESVCLKVLTTTHPVHTLKYMMQTSKIATEVATTLMNIFAGQTVTHDEVLAQITAQYAFANKRTGITSYPQVTDTLERRGATYRYTGPNYTGTCLYTFPGVAA